MPADLTGEARQHAKQTVVFGEDFANRGSGVDTKRMKLAEQQEAEDLIHFRARRNHVANRGVARPARPKFGRGFNLRAKIRRRVEQGPLAWSRIGIPGKLSLRAWGARELAFPHSAAIRTRAIPLREATTRRAAQNFYAHVEESKKKKSKTARRQQYRQPWNLRVPPPRGRELEVAVTVRVDFAAQADLFNLRSFPLHGCILF